MLITRDEFGELTAVHQINDLCRAQPEVVAKEQAEALAGVRGWFNTWPEWVLIKMAKLHVAHKQYAYNGIRTAVGEEDLNGKIYTGEGYPGMAELGFIGTASVLGKIATEMLRRLEKEQAGDREAGFRRWDPPSEAI